LSNTKKKKTPLDKEKKKEEFSLLELELLSLEIKRTIINPTKKQKTKDKSKKKTLDDSIDSDEETDNEESSEEISELENIDYSLLEKQFVIDGSFYGAKEEGYLGFATLAIEDPYESKQKEAEEYSLSDSETMDDKEAETTVEEILYQAAVGINEIDTKTKQRFNNWQMFNKTLLFLYEALSPIKTNDVNYNFDV
jgi:hypothetical protein